MLYDLQRLQCADSWNEDEEQCHYVITFNQKHTMFGALSIQVTLLEIIVKKGSIPH